MAALILVDTDVLIDAGRNVTEAVTCLREIEQRSAPAVSVVTQMELMVGCRNKVELKTLDGFLKRFQIVSLTDQMSEVAAGLMRRYLVTQVHSLRLE